MGESERISHLIGDIYDAALDAGLWPSVLEKTCQFCKGQTAALMVHRPAQAKAEFFVEWGSEPRFLESYGQTYAKLNPMVVPAMVYPKVGAVFTASDFIPQEELLACRFYKEWLAPQGIIDLIAVLFDKSATSYSHLTVQRNKRHGLVDAESKRRFGLLVPHFRRAVAVARIIDVHRFEAGALADSLDGLTAAFFLVDAAGRVVHANAAAHALLNKGDVVRLIARKFRPVDAQADEMLSDIFIHAENGDAAINTKGIDVPLVSSSGESHVAHVLPLTSGARRKAGVTYSAVAAVFVRRVDFELPHPLETIATVFKLTPAEMRVLMTVFELGGPREVAPVLGISEPTVRTHLQHIFEKTGTSRQADLVKLVAGYISPLSG